MRIEAVLFAGNLAKGHRKMAGVLAASAAENCPRASLVIHEITGADTEIAAAKRSNVFRNNAHKTKHQHDLVQAAVDGELLCLIYTDTMVLRDLSTIAEHDFDLAYTSTSRRQISHQFRRVVRASDRIRQFFDRWRLIVERMLADAVFHAPWRDRYGGVHQAALSYLLEETEQPNQTLPLACDEWNCEPSSYHLFGEHTRVVQVMGNLRDACLHGAVAAG
jgi:hypothetical protein